MVESTKRVRQLRREVVSDEGNASTRFLEMVPCTATLDQSPSNLGAIHALCNNKIGRHANTDTPVTLSSPESDDMLGGKQSE
jgi:hypothetical protein